jgi:pimeloyl-ACP methyl ester carboxylesterase
MTPHKPIYRSPAGEEEVKQRYRQLLNLWPAPSRQLTVPTREGDTFVVAYGPEDGPPVLVLHGSGGNAARWLSHAYVWAQHLRIYAVDVIGEPGLSAPSRPPLTTDAHALWLDDVTNALGLSHAAMMGESTGARLALDYALRRPHFATRLVLLTPSGIGRRKLIVLLVYAVLRPLGEWGLQRTMNFALGPANVPASAPAETTARDAALVDFALVIFKNFKPRMHPIPMFTDDQLRQVTIPLLTIVGGRDTMLDSHHTQRRLKHAVPHATIHLLPDAGHLLPDPTSTILEFLTDPSTTTAP